MYFDIYALVVNGWILIKLLAILLCEAIFIIGLFFAYLGVVIFLVWILLYLFGLFENKGKR